MQNLEEQMSEIKIRTGKKEDLEQIALIEKECFSVPWSREALEEDMLGNRLSTYIVAEIDEVVCGYVGFWTIVDECHINNVALLPKYRRRHIGSAIIGALASWADESDIAGITLEVRESNEAAIGLYSSFGFKPGGLRKGYYEDNGENAVIMWREGRKSDEE